MTATILVTGASGAAGQFVVPALLEDGYKVRGQFARKPGAARDVDWRQMDFLNADHFGPLVEGCDAVVHLAAELRHTRVMDRVNVDATRNLAAAAAAAGVRYFGHASSVVVYGSPLSPQVDENTRRIDPRAPIEKQYLAEPYMCDYARTKALAEEALEALSPAMVVDMYRPAVVADLDRLLEAREWSVPRKIFSLHRRTQYIYAADAAAAILHLIRRGLAAPAGARSISAYNICDESAGLYRDLLRKGREHTQDPRYRAPMEIPYVADILKQTVKHRTLTFRYPLGMLRFSNAKLRATGFELPIGMPAALNLAFVRASQAPV